MLWKFLVVPSKRKRQQTDEAVGVLGQLDGVPIQPHLFHVGADVVTGVTFAECLVCYGRDPVVLWEINPSKPNWPHHFKLLHTGDKI